MQTSLWNNLHPNQVIGTPATVKEIDCLTATVNDIAELRSNFTSVIKCNTRFCGFSGWFDVHFRVRWYSCIPDIYEWAMTNFPVLVTPREEWKIQLRKRLS